MVKCQVCGEEAGDNEFCPNCGYKIPIIEETLDNDDFEEFSDRYNKICPHCGARLYINAIVCSHCGFMVGNSSVFKTKNQALAIVLSFLIPGTGQIYLGFRKTGLTFFLLTYFGLPVFMFITFVFFFLFQFFILGSILMVGLIIIEVLIWLYNVYDIITSSDALQNGEFVEDSIFKF